MCEEKSNKKSPWNVCAIIPRLREEELKKRILYRSWGHTAHRGWERLLLNRRSLVQVPNAARHRARADDRYYEENIMESYFHPEIDHHIGAGP